MICSGVQRFCVIDIDVTSIHGPSSECITQNLDRFQGVRPLSGLVARYDEEHFASESKFSPIESLRYLCEQNDMTASAFGELLANRSLGSKVQRGQRQLSKEHIRKLCDRFSVSSDLLL